MSLKKTDLAKQMGLKIDSKRKATHLPDRFGKQSTALNKQVLPDGTVNASPKLVPVTCRLPSDMVQRLREMALTHAGGIHGLMADAAQQWLEKGTEAPPKAKPTRKTPDQTTKKAAS